MNTLERSRFFQGFLDVVEQLAAKARGGNWLGIAPGAAAGGLVELMSKKWEEALGEDPAAGLPTKERQQAAAVQRASPVLIPAAIIDLEPVERL